MISYIFFTALPLFTTATKLRSTPRLGVLRLPDAAAIATGLLRLEPRAHRTPNMSGEALGAQNVGLLGWKCPDNSEKPKKTVSNMGPFEIVFMNAGSENHLNFGEDL